MHPVLLRGVCTDSQAYQNNVKRLSRRKEETETSVNMCAMHMVSFLPDRVIQLSYGTATIRAPTRNLKMIPPTSTAMPIHAIVPLSSASNVAGAATGWPPPTGRSQKLRLSHSRCPSTTVSTSVRSPACRDAHVSGPSMYFQDAIPGHSVVVLCVWPISVHISIFETAPIILGTK